MKIFTLVILIPIFSICQAQPNSDCVSAIPICSSASIVIPNQSGSGLISEGYQPPCVGPEWNSTWFTFSFKTTGLFYFTITPAEFFTDIDFALYETELDCNSISTIRCMQAGETVGWPTDTICYGPTGLSPNSTDFYEAPGCIGNDNFVAALNADTNKIYYLMVNNFFSVADSHYTIDITSFAEFNCGAVFTEEGTKKELISLYPNPASNYIEFNFDRSLNPFTKILVSDIYGRLHLEQNLNSQEKIRINLTDIPPGVYVAIFSGINILNKAIPFIKI